MHMKSISGTAPILIGVMGLLFSVIGGCQYQPGGEPSVEEIEAQDVTGVRSKEDYEEAIRNFQMLLEKYPNDVVTLISLGNAYYDMDMEMEAIELYNKALDIYPDNVTVRTDLGTAYRRIGKPEEALKQYRRSLALDPRHSTARYNMGVVLLWDKKDVDGAIKIWEDLLKVDPYFVLSAEIRDNIKVLNEIRAESAEAIQ